MARAQLADFVAELRARGFDGFPDADLIRYVNWGYRDIARLTRWYWEETSWDVSLAAGSYRFEIAASLSGLKSVTNVASTTQGYETKLAGISDDEFYSQWAAFDLTSSQNRGEPTRYWLSGTHLYILPPPAASRDFTVTGEQDLTDLESGTNETPITPADYDEAILLTAEVHCHIRARQPAFAEVNRALIRDFFDDAVSEQNSRMSDRVERVVAGRTVL